jgi:undecaprenyl-diphosphatase
MNYLVSVVLGIVEGLTEFLPISSTGHLILFNQWFAFSESFTKLFDIVVQAGAILAVIVLFWKDVLPRKAIRENKSSVDWKPWLATWSPVIVAFIPTAIIGALLGSKAQQYLFSAPVVAAALIFYGVIFLLVERRRANSKPELRASSFAPSKRDALIVGCAQSLALVPGTSRSGVTMIALLLLGYARPAAARFSFLLAIPTLLAASAYSLLKYREAITASQYGYLAVGFAVAFVSAYLVSRWFMDYISRRTFVPFAWYRIALGLLVLVWFAI